MNQEQEEGHQQGGEYPEPNYGTPENIGIEQTKFLSENEVFEYDEVTGEILGGDLPPIIKQRFWAFLLKDSVLTWIRDERDVRKIMQKLEIAIKSFRMRLAPGEFDLVMLNDLDNLRKVVYDKTLRAYEGFERTTQSTQISQNYYGQMDNSQTRQRSGISKFVGGMFGQ